MNFKNEIWVFIITESGVIVDVRSTKESAFKEVKRLKGIDKVGSYKIEAWEVEE